MKLSNPMLMCDFYKISHREQYPKGITEVYSTWTPRSNGHLPNVDKVVVFGIQGAITELNELFTNNFFDMDKTLIVEDYRNTIKTTLGIEPETKHIEDLHDLGYLPLEFMALPEGSLVDVGVPYLTIRNTDPKFFWLTNFVETLLSSLLWKPATVASIARKYHQILTNYANKTSDSGFIVPFQAHDFSMRGMSGPEDAARSSAGHLLYFVGTDTIPAIKYLDNYYYAMSDRNLVGTSVYATEHSVMCAGGKDDEYETYRRLIEDVHPKGILSIVSDTWDLWNVVTNILPRLRDTIELRGMQDGINKVVIRPDSGNPADILCGLEDSLGIPYKTAEEKGLIELLWEIFGGTVNSKGYKELAPCIGAIYGDSITLDRAEEICRRLEAKGFASTNIVLGIGSYTYQYLTRDSLGFAMKATSVTIDGVQKPIFKDPKTDSGTKKSQFGKIKVSNGKLYDESSPEFESITCDLVRVRQNDIRMTYKSQTLDDIKKRLGV